MTVRGVRVIRTPRVVPQMIPVVVIPVASRCKPVISTKIHDSLDALQLISKSRRLSMRKRDKHDVNAAQAAALVACRVIGPRAVSPGCNVLSRAPELEAAVATTNIKLRMAMKDARARARVSRSANNADCRSHGNTVYAYSHISAPTIHLGGSRCIERNSDRRLLSRGTALLSDHRQPSGGHSRSRGVARSGLDPSHQP